MDAIDDEIGPLLDGAGNGRLQGHPDRAELGQKSRDDRILGVSRRPFHLGQAPPGVKTGIAQGGRHMGHQITADDLSHHVRGLGADDIQQVGQAGSQGALAGAGGATQENDQGLTAIVEVAAREEAITGILKAPGLEGGIDFLTQFLAPDLIHSLLAQAGMDQGGSPGGHVGTYATTLQVARQDAGGKGLGPILASHHDPGNPATGIIVAANLRAEAAFQLLAHQAPQFMRGHDLGIAIQLITKAIGNGIGLGKRDTNIHQRLHQDAAQEG